VEETKRRFIIVTIGPRERGSGKLNDGLLAGFSTDKDSGIKFLSVFRENHRHLMKVSAYFISKIHWCLGDCGEGMVFFRTGNTPQENEETMDRAVKIATRLFKKLVASCGVPLTDGNLPSKYSHTGFPPLQGSKQGHTTPSENTMAGTPAPASRVPITESTVGQVAGNNIRVIKPTKDWRKPLWISRRSNQHTARTSQKIKDILLKRIAEAAANAADEEVDTEEKATGYRGEHWYNPETGRIVPANSLCFRCASRNKCTYTIEWKACNLFKQVEEDTYAHNHQPNACG
jgi:hypothetical protein